MGGLADLIPSAPIIRSAVALDPSSKVSSTSSSSFVVMADIVLPNFTFSLGTCLSNAPCKCPL